jgi:hypothetical protein
VDSRLRRSPPDRASAVPYGQAGENARLFPTLPTGRRLPTSFTAQQQQQGYESDSGKSETISRPPALAYSPRKLSNRPGPSQLADFYEAREIITFTRFRGYSREEGASRPTEIWETESDFRALNGYFVPAERLAKKSEFFARFQAHRYRFLALFGAELTKPFDEMIKIRSEILSAVEMLIANYRHPDLELVPGDRQEALAIIGRAKDDPIAGRLDNAVEAIERTCRPVTQEIAR